MLAGGADAAVIPSGVGGFAACKALSQRNASPEGASRPWDKQRDGFVLGEGAGTNPDVTLRCLLKGCSEVSRLALQACLLLLCLL